MKKECSTYFNSEYWICDKPRSKSRRKKTNVEKKQFQMRHQMRNQLAKEAKAIEEKLPNDFNKLLQLIITEVLSKKPLKICPFVANLLDLLLECRNREEKEFYEPNRFSKKDVEVKDDPPAKYGENDKEEDEEDRLDDATAQQKEWEAIQKYDFKEEENKRMAELKDEEEDEADESLYILQDDDKQSCERTSKDNLEIKDEEEDEADDSSYVLQDDDKQLCEGTPTSNLEIRDEEEDEADDSSYVLQDDDEQMAKVTPNSDGVKGTQYEDDFEDETGDSTPQN